MSWRRRRRHLFPLALDSSTYFPPLEGGVEGKARNAAITTTVAEAAAAAAAVQVATWGRRNGRKKKQDWSQFKA